MAKKKTSQPSSTKPKPKPKPTPKRSTTTSSTASPSSSTIVSPLPPPPNAQRILDVFQHAFRPTLAATDELSALVQEAKAALFERDFARAFSRPELLRAYAARWSPTRAACYAGVLEMLLGGGESGLLQDGDDDDGDGGHGEGMLRVVAFGGATAELAALSAFLEDHKRWKHADVTLVDLAPWQSALDPLYSSLTTQLPPTPYVPVPRPPLSAPSQLSYTFTQADILSLPTNPALRAQVSSATLVTLLFTLNELYTGAGVGRTTAFLLALTGLVRAGGVLAVADSPGSYAETAVGRDGAKRRYPIKWLLDHTLLEQAGEGEKCCWEKVREEESAWFRWGEGGEVAGWRYPVGLEDMRFQMHVYRATGRGERIQNGEGDSKRMGEESKETEEENKKMKEDHKETGGENKQAEEENKEEENKKMQEDNNGTEQTKETGKEI